MAHKSDSWLIANVHNTARFFTANRHIAWMTLVATLLWGVVGYARMPQRKDPDIPVKVALAICQWPGVDALRVEQLDALGEELSRGLDLLDRDEIVEVRLHDLTAQLQAHRGIGGQLDARARLDRVGMAEREARLGERRGAGLRGPAELLEALPEGVVAVVGGPPSAKRAPKTTLRRKTE